MANAEINEKNILAIKGHSEATRKMFKKLEAKVSEYEVQNSALVKEVEELKKAINHMRVAMFSGGPTE